MAQLVKIKLMDKEAEFKLTDNVLTKSSITDAFLLPFDALVSLYRSELWKKFLESDFFLDNAYIFRVLMVPKFIWAQNQKIEKSMILAWYPKR
ncbi:hypothetical protein M3Y95_00793200 [Aphelenchoides besseyi]|nr:hypothetical protein M3Y95_00793200 [Aphelenchoides besseyi]